MQENDNNTFRFIRLWEKSDLSEKQQQQQHQQQQQ